MKTYKHIEEFLIKSIDKEIEKANKEIDLIKLDVRYDYLTCIKKQDPYREYIYNLKRHKEVLEEKLMIASVNHKGINKRIKK